MKFNSLWLMVFFYAENTLAQNPKLIPVANAWANNSVNAVVFRKNSLVTFRDTQFIAFYDDDRFLVLGKRKSGTAHWQIQKTLYQGNAADAHNTIALMVDGDGFLHLSWDHHANPLRYCRSVSPGSLILGDKRSMTGIKENQITYPEFYKLPDGNLLFFYRDGKSGQGDLIINHYDTKTQKWGQLSHNLISGEGQRNPYTQACVDGKGTIHISWVWRESPDVASNHDLAYARSTDGGKTWEKSTGEKYQLPITVSTAEYAVKIPQKSELINQTSMTTDAAGHPYIATYWRDSATTVPQYHIVYQNGSQWKVQNLGFPKTAFSLSGGGTKSIPISRPQILVSQKNNRIAALLIFRNEERGSKVSTAISSDLEKGKWTVHDLTTTSVGSWEPSYDTELWKKKHVLNLFVEKVEQIDGEGNATVAPQMVHVLEWKPKLKLGNLARTNLSMNKKSIASFIVFFWSLTCCFAQHTSFKQDKSLLQTINQNFKDADAQYKVLTQELPPNQFPKTYHPDTRKQETSNSGWWCSGFYPGTLLFLYQQTKDQALLTEANRMLNILQKEQYNKTTHDLGFMMYCSFGNANKIEPKPEYKEILINSAKSLSTRFDPKVGAIKSWDSNKPEYLVIIDNMMNLELLFWATKATGDSSFYKIAVTHANTTMKNHFRPDYSSYHVINYNPETGAVQQKRTAQGYADESAWARGQAWGLYGYTVMYRETHDKKYLDQAQHIASFILQNPNLPNNKIPYWDYNAPNIPDDLRDASAATIMASALLELGKYTDQKDSKTYFSTAETILKNLSASPYKAKPGTNGGYILEHSVGHMPNKKEIDVPLTYADYYFVEAMIRYKNLNKSKQE